MEILFLLLALVVLAFALASFVGWLWITFSAFGQGQILWGLGCFFISPLSLVYGFINFHRLRIPVYMMLGGILAGIAGQILLVIFEPMVG